MLKTVPEKSEKTSLPYSVTALFRLVFNRILMLRSKILAWKPSATCNKYILLDVLLCSIAEYFYELCRILTSP